MRKWIALALVLLLALGGYVAAGPYLAIRGIQQALKDQDVSALSDHVDFAALRVSFRAQLEDALARRAGSEMQSSLLGQLGLSLGNRVVGLGVDAMVTPVGVAALLQGRSVWKRALGETANGDTYGPPAPVEPLKQAEHRYASLSRFTATTYDQAGAPTVFVFTRQGLRWQLTDIRLPLFEAGVSGLRQE
jgi:hypothetical protein